MHSCRSVLYQHGFSDHILRHHRVSQWSPAPLDHHLLIIVSMLLPFPVLLRSHIQKRKKFALLGLLALGVFITIIQVIRIQTVKNLANYLDSASIIMWSTVENNMGIIGNFVSYHTALLMLTRSSVASIPTLAPLFRYFADKTQKGSTVNSASRSRSLYALKSKRGATEGSCPINSGVDRATHIYGPSEGAGSEEFILANIGAITKKTEVEVVAYSREDLGRRQQ